MTNETSHPLGIDLEGSDATTTLSTNAVSEPSPVTGNEASSSGSWTTPALIILGVGLAIVAVRKLKSSAKAFEKDVKELLLEDILDAIAKDAPNRAALRTELAAAIDGNGSLRTNPLSSILRIEESYEKKASGRYLRRVSILRRKDGTTGSLVKIENEIGWEYLPEDFRDQFIATRKDKVVRLVYEAERKSST